MTLKYANGREAQDGDPVIGVVMDTTSTIKVICGVTFGTHEEGMWGPNQVVGVNIPGQVEPVYFNVNESTPDKVDPSIRDGVMWKACRVLYHAEDAFLLIDKSPFLNPK